MKKNFKKIAWQVVAIGLILVGAAGLLLPFLQGIIFILLGLFILSLVSDPFKTRWHNWRKKFSGLHARISIIEEKIEKKIGHWFHD
ncbi:MAG: hypothetical protein WC250_02945 [Candidatus Paceibacterota bacterium]|jgi:uncharacterized protein YqgC (DUF456 family)